MNYSPMNERHFSLPFASEGIPTRPSVTILEGSHTKAVFPTQGRGNFQGLHDKLQEMSKALL
jgi:hypothetical protein